MVETQVLVALRNRVFFTLDEANARPLTTDRTLTRRTPFGEREKPLLKPLPAELFVIGRWSRYKLAPDYHETFLYMAMSRILIKRLAKGLEQMA